MATMIVILIALGIGLGILALFRKTPTPEREPLSEEEMLNEEIDIFTIIVTTGDHDGLPK
ncbi:MAG: hypothetical protein HQK86_01555 [Nitrospinae bacterium]|nr:hypothetical protein [Nitrospinota bacterium]